MTGSERPSWRESMSAADRVRSVATTLEEPRTANRIASEAEVAHATAKKYLTRLVAEGALTSDESGGKTVYGPDPVGQYLTEMHDLYSAYEPDELADRLVEMTERIDGWQTTYSVETPNELRSLIGEADDETAAISYREIAIEWDHLRYRQSLVEDTLRLYDRFDGDPAPATV